MPCIEAIKLNHQKLSNCIVEASAIQKILNNSKKSSLKCVLYITSEMFSIGEFLCFSWAILFCFSSSVYLVPDYGTKEGLKTLGSRCFLIV